MSEQAKQASARIQEIVNESSKTSERAAAQGLRQPAQLPAGFGMLSDLLQNPQLQQALGGLGRQPQAQPPAQAENFLSVMMHTIELLIAQLSTALNRTAAFDVERAEFTEYKIESAVARERQQHADEMDRVVINFAEAQRQSALNIIRGLESRCGDGNVVSIVQASKIVAEVFNMDLEALTKETNG